MIIYRKLLHSDYDDILDISKDIWDGNDYIPAVFHDWVDTEGLFLGAQDSENGKIIGIGKYSILYDGSGWLEGLRVHSCCRGRKIARGLSEYLLNYAKEELKKGNITKIGFATHITNIESITLMKKLNFVLESEYLIAEKPYENLRVEQKLKEFNIKPWDINFEEFKTLNYFTRRKSLLPLGFTFQELTERLFEEMKSKGSLIVINGYRGIYKNKGNLYFEVMDEGFDAIDTFMNYFLFYTKENNLLNPQTSVLPCDKEILNQLANSGYDLWEDWKPDYLYYVYRE